MIVERPHEKQKRRRSKTTFCEFSKGDEGFKVAVPDPPEPLTPPSCLPQCVRSQRFTVNDVSRVAGVLILMEIF